jgi:hypothetical protein
MPSIDFKRVRARVTNELSEEPITDAAIVQQAAEHASSLGLSYPPVKGVDPAQGIWDLYLPAELVQALHERQARTFRVESEGYYLVVDFLDE